MASMSKLFTSILVVQQVERGAIRLEEPVASYLPPFAAQGKGAITVRRTTAWFGGSKDATTATLTTQPLAVPAKASVGFDVFGDTESSDPLTLESSTDGGTTWKAVPFTVRDDSSVTQVDGAIAQSGTRRWLQAKADLPPGAQQLRWRYTTDATGLGRGAYVDGVKVAGQGGVVLDGERHPEAFTAQGWTQASR